MSVCARARGCGALLLKLFKMLSTLALVGSPGKGGVFA